MSAMSYNNSYLIQSLGELDLGPDESSSATSPANAHASSSRDPNPLALTPPAPKSPTLISPLPTIHDLEKEANLASAKEFVKQSEEFDRERLAAEAAVELDRQAAKKEVRESNGTWARLIAGRRGGAGGKGKEKEVVDWNAKTFGFERPPNAYELYAAIDTKDIMYIMRVRDHAFPLLLQKNAGEFPIVYASRIGASHRDIAILICGALSRYVNQLEEEDFKKKETLGTLRMLRINLKLAIDTSLLPTADPSLLSSYLQVLIMSEGDKWVLNAVHEVALLLRVSTVTGPSGISPDRSTSVPATNTRDSTDKKVVAMNSSAPLGPVDKAQAMMREFCTKELKNVQNASLGVEQYISNAVMDLVVMAVWSLVVDQVGGEGLPTYTFARDQRTFSLFEEASTNASRGSGFSSKVGKRLQYQVDTLLEVCGDTKLSIQTRVAELRRRL